MKKIFSTIAITAALLSISISDCPGQPAANEEIHFLNSEEIRFLNSGFLSNHIAKKLLDDAPDSTLKRYKFQSDLKLATLAAWVDCKRKCNLHPEKQLVLRGEFIGYLAGRLQCEIPDWWKSEILALDVVGREDISLPKHGDHPQAFSKSNGVTHVKNISLELLSSDRIVGKLNGAKFDLEWTRGKTGLAKRFNKKVGAFAARKLKSGQMIWAINAKTTARIPIFCTDETGQLIWESKVPRVDNFSLANGGDFNGYMDFRTFDNSVYLFGVSETGLFLVGFDAITGAVTLRLSTSI